MPAFEIAPNAVHVWRIALDRTTGHAEARAVLSEDERARADRFRFDHDRDRWVTAHHALRRTLGFYLDQAPEALRFHIGPHGKPALADVPDDRSFLEFNLSHSGAHALIAVTCSNPVGVDLERVQTNIAWRDLAHVFTADEQAILDAASDQVQTFYRLWTRKEAFLKAIGTGLPAGLSSEPPGAPGFIIYDLMPADGYLGAVAVPADVTNLVHFDGE